MTWKRFFKRTRIASDSPIPTKPIHDLRVIMPEGFQDGMPDGYMDFDLNPLQLSEIQRVGLFLIEHFAESLVAHTNLQLLERKYQEERTSHGSTRRELHSLGSAMEEVAHERDHFKAQWQEAITEIQQLQQQLEALQGAAKYDKQYIQELERQLEGQKVGDAQHD